MPKKITLNNFILNIGGNSSLVKSKRLLQKSIVIKKRGKTSLLFRLEFSPCSSFLKFALHTCDIAVFGFIKAILSF